MSTQGLVKHQSLYTFDETPDRLIQAIRAKDISLLARIDHGLAARQAGLELSDTTILIFGNPRGGTPLMAANPEVGIDLPLRILVWTDDKTKLKLLTTIQIGFHSVIV